MKKGTFDVIIEDLSERLRLAEMQISKLNEELRIEREKHTIIYNEIAGANKTMA